MSLESCLKTHRIPDTLATRITNLAATYTAKGVAPKEAEIRAAAILHEQYRDQVDKARSQLQKKGFNVSVKETVTPGVKSEAQKALNRLMKEATDAGIGKEQANILVGTLFNRISKTLANEKVSPEKILNSFTFRAGKAGEEVKGSVYQDAGFYSALSQTVDRFEFKQATKDVWLSRLKSAQTKGGFKLAEIDDLGLIPWLESLDRPITKLEVLEFIAEGGVQTTETRFGDMTTLVNFEDFQQANLDLINSIADENGETDAYWPELDPADGSVLAFHNPDNGEIIYNVHDAIQAARDGWISEAQKDGMMELWDKWQKAHRVDHYAQLHEFPEIQDAYAKLLSGPTELVIEQEGPDSIAFYNEDRSIRLASMADAYVLLTNGDINQEQLYAFDLVNRTFQSLQTGEFIWPTGIEIMSRFGQFLNSTPKGRTHDLNLITAGWRKYIDILDPTDPYTPINLGFVSPTGEHYQHTEFYRERVSGRITSMAAWDDLYALATLWEENYYRFIPSFPEGLLDEDTTARGPKFPQPQYHLTGGANYRERTYTLPTGRKETFSSGHYPDGDYLFHVRLQDFDDTMVIEEIQSDRFQTARDMGFKGDKFTLARVTPELRRRYRRVRESATDGDWFVFAPGGKPLGALAASLSEEEAQLAAQTQFGHLQVAKAPLSAAWEMFAFKKALREAIQSGFKKLAWTQGIEQIKRYTDSTRAEVDRIVWSNSGVVLPAPWVASALHETGLTAEAFLRLSPDAQLENLNESSAYRAEVLSEMGYTVEEFEDLSDSEQEEIYDEIGNSNLHTALRDIFVAAISEDTGPETTIAAFKNGVRRFMVTADLAGYMSHRDDKIDGEHLKKAFGTEIANQILAAPNGEITGDNLTVGGEGFKNAYDVRLPSGVQKLIKRYGATVQADTIDGHQVWSFEITDELKKFVSETGMPVYDPARGMFQPINLGGIITMFERATAATPFHELGHGIYQLMGTMVQQGIASAQVKKDFDTITAWLRGIDYEKEWELSVSQNPAFIGKTWETLTDEERRQAMAVAETEYFARGFTRYLYEGQAPTRELDGVFARLRAWMKEVYKSIADLHVKLNPEVRKVFDRMLTTEFNVSTAAQDIGIETWSSKDLKALGMAPEDQMYFRKLLGEAKTNAEAKMEQAQNKGLRSLRKQWREQALESLKSDPTQELVEILRKGYGLDYDQFVERYGEEAAKGLPKGVLKKDGNGRALDEVAFERGYDNAEQALNALWSWRPAKEIAAEMAEQKVEEHLASFQAIDFLLASDEYASALELVDKYLRSTSPVSQEAQLQQRLTSPRPSRTTISRQALQAHARMTLENTSVSEATSTRYLTAVKAAQVKERSAISKGDYAAAAKYNELSRLNFEMARESARIKNEVAKALRLAKSVNRAKKGLIAENYHRAVAKAMLRFGLTTSTKVKIDEAPVLANLLSPREDALLETGASFSDFIIDETVVKPYKDLTVAEFRELTNLIKYLNGTGRMLIDDRLHVSKYKRGQFVAQIGENAAILPDFKIKKEGTWARAIQDSVSKYWAENSALLWIIRALDGYDALKGKPGFLETHFINQLEKAWAGKAKGRAQVGELFLPAINQLTKSGAKFKDDGLTPLPKNFVMQGKTWDWDARVAVALNMGNKTNLDRLMKGYKLTREQVDNLVKPLTDADWEAVQMIGEAIGSLWPGVASAHEKINFFTPTKVDATPFTTPTGKQMRGWYYPIKYDHSDNTVYNWTERDKIMEDASAALLPATVASGATQARVKDAGGLPLRLETKVAFEHIEWALQYTNYAAIVTDIDSILRRQDMRDLIQAKLGFEKYKAMRAILKSIAHPNLVSDASVIEKGMYQLQSMVAAYVLGLNPYVALQQPLAIFNYLGAEGGLVKGGSTWLTGAYEFLRNSSNALNVMNNMAPGLKEHYMFIMRDKKDQFKHAAMELKAGTGPVAHTLYVAKDAAVKGMQVMMAIMDATIAIPGWLGSYYTRLNSGMTPEQAALEATKVLSMYTPLNRAMDKTVLQNKKGLGAMYTFLTGFAVKAQNEMGTYGRAWKAGKISFDEYLSHVILVRVMPVIVTHMMYSLISSDDREKEDTWMKKLFGIFMDSIAYRFIGSPILRDVVQVGTNTVQKVVLDKKAYDRNPFQLPATAAVELFNRASTSIVKYVKDMDDDQKRLKGLLAFGELLTFGTKIPVFKLVSNIIEGSRQNYDLEGTKANIFLKPDPDLRRKK